MQTYQDYLGNVTVQPFEHDCPNCYWLGWHMENAPDGDGLYHSRMSNLYLHVTSLNPLRGSLLHRYSDSPGDYSCKEFHGLSGATRRDGISMSRDQAIIEGARSIVVALHAIGLNIKGRSK